jgi:hypothetical protein
MMPAKPPTQAATETLTFLRLRNRCAIRSLLPLLLAAMFASCEKEPPNPQRQAAATDGGGFSPCKLIVRQILNDPDRDILIAKATPAFATLLRRGFGPAGRVDFDPRFDTQDELPLVTGLGQAYTRGNRIHIPVNLVFPVNSWRSSEVSFTKTYVFIRLNGRWQLEDILSSGRETPIPGSFRSWLD